MADFITIDLSKDKCIGVAKCGACVKVCPVNIFRADDDNVLVMEANEDECTLCELCSNACKPAAISVRKMY
jgi:ferredoxin